MIAVTLHAIGRETPRCCSYAPVAEARVRERSGVSIVGVIQGDDIQVNPDPLVPLPSEAEILVIGSEDAEADFLEIFAQN